jgi:GT2 family glycosyltransferase
MAEVLVSVLVLAFGAEPYLDECVGAALTYTDDRVEVIVIDNGSAAAATLRDHPRLRVGRPGKNLGFAGGCNHGARLARGRTLVFLNSDAIVEPDAITRLVEVAEQEGVGLASGDIRLAADPSAMNTAGNPVHYLGVVWAGSYGEPAAQHDRRADITSASGAFMAITREKWQQLGGFDETYFAYHEDTELSLRCWLRGWRVVFVPGATVRHHYEFSRNPAKQYLLERNRWITVLTVYPTSTLVRVLPALLAFDAAVFVAALLQGWAGAKARAWMWLIANRRAIATRRREIQAESTASAREFAALLADRIEPAMIERPPGLGVLNSGLAAYWRIARIGLRR